MVNWYKKARRGNIPLMDSYTMFGKGGDEDMSEPKSLTKVNPFFGGNERSTSDGKGYPRGISQFEDSGDDKGGVSEIPSGRTILDDDIFQGAGANDDRFSDSIDIPGKLHSKEPIGIHNMQNKNVFDYVSKKLKVKNLNKV